MSGKKVIVFFARDFLSNWFSDLGFRLKDYIRIYIVSSDREAENVLEKDPKGKIYNLSDVRYSGSDVEYGNEFLGFNRDRFLRWESNDKIKSAVNSTVNVANDICSTYEVSLYMDEPIANFPNYYFNKSFKSVGALCLHFQTSWVPGYGFFCSDAAQAEPFRLGCIFKGDELVESHFKQRGVGKGLPLYVLTYDKFYLRLYDSIKLFFKGVVKSITRKQDYYLRQSHSSDFFHAKCLFASLIGSYDNVDMLTDRGSKFVVYPMHYEPESLLTYFSEYTRQTEAVSQIIDSLPVGYELVIKEHPSQPGALSTAMWREIVKHKRVHKIFGTKKIDSILKFPGTAVVSFGSTMVLEAALHGAKCAVFGHVHFAEAPGIVKIKNIVDWPKCLGSSCVSSDEILSWYSSFVNTYCIEDIPMPGMKLSNGEIEEVFHAL